MPAHSYKIGTQAGPGVLKFGATGSQQDFSCQAQSCALEPDKDADDAIKVLCGDSVAGAVTYTWKLTGTFLQDLRTGATEGITMYCLSHAGQEVDFLYTPNSVESPGFKGKVTIDPTAIGGDVGDVATADFEFDVTGQPQVVPATP